MMALIWFVVIFGAAYLTWRTIHNDRKKQKQVRIVSYGEKHTRPKA